MSKVNRDPDPLDRLVTVEKFMRDAENGTKSLRPDPRFLQGLGGGSVTIENLQLDLGAGLTDAGILFDMGNSVVGYESIEVKILWLTYGFFKFRYSAAEQGVAGLTSPGAYVSPVGGGPDYYKFELFMEGSGFDRLKELQTAIGYSNLLLPVSAAPPGGANVRDNTTTIDDSGQTGYFSSSLGQFPVAYQFPLFYNDGSDYLQGNLDYWLLYAQ